MGLHPEKHPHEQIALDVSPPHVRALLESASDILVSAEISQDGTDVDALFFGDLGVQLGYAPGEIPRRLNFAGIAALMYPGDGDRFAAELASAITTGKFAIEVRHLGPAGEVTWWDLRAVPIAYDAGLARWWVACGRNVTQRKKDELELRSALEELTKVKAQLELENRFLLTEYEREHEFSEIIGTSRELKAALELVRRVAATTTPVLITGETGTGKELVARAVHQHSPRKGRPMAVINCAAMPATLIESELFGHEKGAFTGAIRRQIGRFEFAHGGTLFLDEIGELPLELQAKLLRFLQSGEFERVGSAETRKVDVRVIAATNRNLEAEVTAGRFRSDLYYRLGVFPIRVPPLRQRKSDIPLLVSYLVDKKGAVLGKKFKHISGSAIAALETYDWPGNVRELENIIERAIILSDGPVFQLHETAFPSGIQRGNTQTPPSLVHFDEPTQNLLDFERAHIEKVCADSHWKIKGPGGAAEKLGLNPSTLYFKLKKLGITRPS